MKDFSEIVLQTFKNKCNAKFVIREKNKNIIQVDFTKFAIILYYSAYEYEIGINYYKRNTEISLDTVLLNVGCGSELIPTFKYMSNEEIMSSYLGEYIKLINQFFSQLCNYKSGNN